MKPIVQAMLIADYVYKATTGKYIIAGTFGSIVKTGKKPQSNESGEDLNVDKQPIEVLATYLRAGSPHLYLNFIDFSGTHSFQLRYLNLKDDSVYFEMGFTAVHSDPLINLELSLALPELPNEKVGNYALELLWEKEIIGCCRVSVVELQPG